MKKIEEFNFEKPKLFACYIGGKIEGCNIEMHDTVFVVAKNTAEFIANVKQKVTAFTSFHIDSWVVLQNVDGYEITLKKEKQTSDNKLYFVNLGSYLAGKFGENHFMHFCVAKSRSDAIEIAKKMIASNEELVHGDNIYNLDDCIKLDKIGDLFIHLIISEPENLVINNGYFNI
jgi:hypothetical protein